MVRFLKSNELNAELEKTFEFAKNKLILISPYIKLHERFKSSLHTKLQDDRLEIIVLFGKNEDDMSKSMEQNTFNFFKKFPNIQILFEKRLHAKYYANESRAILTSMNLYGFSQNNNIETGVMIEKSFRNVITGENSFDIDAFEYFETVISQAELLFERLPMYSKKNFLGQKKYLDSKTSLDKLTSFYINKNNSKIEKRYVVTDKNRKGYVKKAINNKGYCIKTGVDITFNLKKPMQYDVFKSWKEFGDLNAPQNYCHFSGELSNNNTSMNRPILSKNWKKAKEKYSL